MLSEDSEADSRPKRKRRVYIDDDSSSDESGIVTTRKKKSKVYIETSDSDSDSSMENVVLRKRKPRVVSDSDSDTSGSEITCRRKRGARVVDESSSSSSDWETDDDDIDAASKASTSNKNSPKQPTEEDKGASSDASDGQSEKCPICLLSFKEQEIGSPESCDHIFCVECIEEWSKNMNTCPVDRQPFGLILVRKKIDGKVVRKITVQTQQNNLEDDISEVPIDDLVCEICGSDQNEDSLLLCDRCDLGYHMACLEPPLEEVPEGEWFCPRCDDTEDNMINFPFPNGVSLFIDIDMDLNLRVHNSSPRRPTQSRRYNSRLVPRTRQNERIITRIRQRRTRNSQNQQEDASAAPVAQSIADNNADTTSTQTRRRRQKRKRRQKKSFKVVYQIDEVTGETIAITKAVRRHKRKSRRQRLREQQALKNKRNVKARLAAQLGICTTQRQNQTLPDVRSYSHSNSSLGFQRHQAGIPQLHLFGQRDELDYFSPSDSETNNDFVREDGGCLLVSSSRPSTSFRRNLKSKSSVSVHIPQTSNVDVLGSILDSQTKFHSKNYTLSVAKDGKIKVDSKGQDSSINKSIKNDLDKFKDNRQNLNDKTKVRQAPLRSNMSESDSTTPTSTNSANTYSPSQNVVRAGISALGRMAAFANFAPSDNRENNSNIPIDYSIPPPSCDSYPVNSTNKDKKNDKDKTDLYYSGENSPATPSDSEFDIYSDIETVSTSRTEECDGKAPSPVPMQLHNINMSLQNDDDNNDSDTDLIIDTEKVDQEKYDPACALESDDEKSKDGLGEPVTSTVDSTGEPAVNEETDNVNSNFEIQSNTVQSSNQSSSQKLCARESDEEEMEDDCPNFSIYSTESINMAKSTDLAMLASAHNTSGNTVTNIKEKTSDFINAESTQPTRESKSKEDSDSFPKLNRNRKQSFYGGSASTSGAGGLYSDSEDENVVKIDPQKPFGITDLQTEDISEEERSYTPCLDEKGQQKQGLEGLDTEMISDDDKNDFEDGNDPKGTSDGDALEINAKESELDFTRPEECEEGEIVDGAKRNEEERNSEPEEPEENSEKEGSNKENETVETNKEKAKSKELSFKKLSRNNKERNYRENRSRSKSRERNRKSDKENENRKEKKRRREIELYNVRSIVAEKPRRLKDQFGRDIVRAPSESDSSKSLTPPPRRPPLENLYRKSISKSRSRSATPRRREQVTNHKRSRSHSPIIFRRSPSRTHRAHSKEKSKKRKTQQRSRRSRSASRHRSRERRKSPYRRKKRHRSSSKERKRRKSRDKTKQKNKKARSRSKSRSRLRSTSPRSPSLRRRDWERGWTPSLSRSPSLYRFRNPSPSWTPPRMQIPAVQPQNLTVILPNDANKKRKEKKKKNDKRTKDSSGKQKKRRRVRSPQPSKEVFASGDNILVSVSFNKDNNIRDVQSRKRFEAELVTRRLRKERERKRAARNAKQQKFAHIKPVAIIDLERSPFREITPSPKDIIVLTDSENDDSNNLMGLQQNICDSSQQLASPPPNRSVNNSYMSNSGPKTPPEPQVKFSLSSKQPQMRPIINPLHEPDDVEEPMETHEEEEEELDNRMNEVMHKGPNTPPEPPNSPPSSPDAYDPFDPTKSRTPTPEPSEPAMQSSSIPGIDDSEDMDQGNAVEKSGSSTLQNLTHTPPVTFADIQPADSQSSLMPSTPDAKTSPERPIGVIINQVVQSQPSSVFPSISKSNQSHTSVAPSIITSTPVNGNMNAPRINILSSTILTPANVSSSIHSSQRIILPNTSRSSPVNKVSPSKTPIKSTPIKPMPVPIKNVISKLPSVVPTNKQPAWKDKKEVALDFDSPYSPGSSDYEDLFEPPPETGAKNMSKSKTKSSQTVFDQLFNSSPTYKNKSKNKPVSSSKNKSKSMSKSRLHSSGRNTKLVGVRMDEDNLKILDELPNSAVEMQVKDKFLKKLNRQERVVEEVKLVLKPHYNKKHVTKEEYKDILRRAVPKICHNKSGEINPKKIQALIEAYVRKIRHSKKVTSSSSVNPQKTEVISNWLSKLN